MCIIIFSLYTTSPIAKNKFGFHHYSNPISNNRESYKEFVMFRALKYKRSANEIFDRRRPYDIDLGDNSIFITNGNRTFLFSALPVKEKNIYCVYSKRDLLEAIGRIKPDNLIYVSQGIWGFCKFSPDNYTAMEPEEFENELTKLLILEKEVFSYYSGEHHVFLYKMLAKNCF